MLHKEGMKMKWNEMIPAWITFIKREKKEEDNLIIEKQSKNETKVMVQGTEEEYEILEREILPAKIICPDCGGVTLDGLDYCHKCGGELNSYDKEENIESFQQEKYEHRKNNMV